MLATETKTKTIYLQKKICYHCGSPCTAQHLNIDNKDFCCNGCATVYEILKDNQLSRYYEMEVQPGSTPESEKDYSILDEEETLECLIDFKRDSLIRTTLKIPAIHCTSCLWLLERLPRLKEGIITARVHFTRKELTLNIDTDKIPLSKVCAFLSELGYQPEITLDEPEHRQLKSPRNRLVKKIAVAGFCFGNIMLFTFPFYFGLQSTGDNQFTSVFSWLNCLLAIPVFTYCAADYWQAGVNFIRRRIVTIDLPILIGVAALTFQSYLEVLSKSGEGYFDSLAGLLFFLLTGRYFQEKVYENLSFERDYKSFFLCGPN